MQQKAPLLTLAGAAVMASLAFSAPAGAAPQALALAATDEATQLTCTDGVCMAEFSAYCLQPDRVAPEPGTPYRMTAASTITITAQDAAGRTVKLPPGNWLRFRSARTHTAVTIELDEAELTRRGLSAPTVALADDVTLSPFATPGDDRPISADELAMVEQSLRPVGAGIVDRNSEGMAAAHIVNRLVNTLPSYEADRAGTGTRWTVMMDRARAKGLSPMAARLAQNGYDLCRYFADRVVPGDMRRCMQGQHDRLMKVLNSDYWKAVKTGS